MKLSFSTLACPTWSLAQILAVAAREGYDGVELRFIEGDDALWDRPELTGGGLPETLARLRDAGLAVACVDTRSFFHHTEPDARARARDEAQRSLDLAARLGARGIRVFGDRVQPGADRETTCGWIAESLAMLQEHADSRGVEVWIETHGDFARAQDTLELLLRAGLSGPSTVWDPANAFECGEQPEHGISVLRGRIGHVHVKDVARAVAAAVRPKLPGQGDFRPDRVLSLLQAEGYDRFVSFEWEKKWHPEIEEPEVAVPHFIRWAAAQMRPAHDDPATSSVHVLERGRLRVEVHPDRSAMGRAAAAVVAFELRKLVARHGHAAAIFASAPSQNEFLEVLRSDAALPWGQITAFHLDEYGGLGPDHPASVCRFLQERLFDHVPVRAFHGLEGRATDVVAECRRYAALLQGAGPGLVVLGVGENGHLAFIDPPVCDFGERADVRVVELDEVCRQQQVHDGAFGRVADVPRTALSLTVPYIMRVPRAVAIVPGPKKRAAIAAALDGPVTTACPASILRRHPDATLFLDEHSAASLGRGAP